MPGNRCGKGGQSWGLPGHNNSCSCLSNRTCREKYRSILRKQEQRKETEREKHWDFPGGPVAKNLLSNAQDSGVIPDQRNKISHAVQHEVHACVN